MHAIFQIKRGEERRSYMEGCKKVAAVAAFLVLVIASNGQSICNVSVQGLMACRPAVTPPRPAPPSAACCSTLSHADLKCLCSYKNSQLLPSLGIDPNLALGLPGKCHLPHPANC